MVDGLKPGQRKILFCSFKRNFVKEAKVAQFSGYVSEHSAYHHGEQSLASTIIGMAQDYVGSNNINLLLPNGQFGTRGQVTDTRLLYLNFLNTVTWNILYDVWTCILRVVKIMPVQGTFSHSCLLLHGFCFRSGMTFFSTI